MGHFFNMATIQEETTIKKKVKKITRRANLSTVMAMCCVDVLTCNTSNRFIFGDFFAKIQEIQNGDVTVSRTCVTICVT